MTDYLSSEELVYYKDPETKEIISGGYGINSLFLANNSSLLNGGNKNNEDKIISKIMENLILPTGLVYQKHHKRPDEEDNNPVHFINYEESANNVENTPALDDDIYNKLLELVKINPTNISKHTRKSIFNKKNNRSKKIKIILV
jgi:hypothetical protein